MESWKHKRNYCIIEKCGHKAKGIRRNKTKARPYLNKVRNKTKKLNKRQSNAWFTHADFVGRFLKFSKQTQAKSRVNDFSLKIFELFITDFGPILAWILLRSFRILCRPKKSACVNPAKDYSPAVNLYAKIHLIKQ